MCFQYFFLPLMFVRIKVMIASVKVNEIFPVRFAPPGKTGTKPSKLLSHTKKNRVSKNGMNLFVFAPRLGLATSSLIKITNGSITFCKPFGALPSLFPQAMPTGIKIKSSNTSEKSRDATFLVIDKSSRIPW